MIAHSLHLHLRLVRPSTSPRPPVNLPSIPITRLPRALGYLSKVDAVLLRLHTLHPTCRIGRRSPLLLLLLLLVGVGGKTRIGFQCRIRDTGRSRFLRLMVLLLNGVPHLFLRRLLILLRVKPDNQKPALRSWIVLRIRMLWPLTIKPYYFHAPFNLGVFVLFFFLFSGLVDCLLWTSRFYSLFS